MTKLLPVALKIDGKKCLVVGGGKVAARKARVLVECGANVCVVAPHLGEELEAMRAQIEYSARVFEANDCDDCDLIFACTSDREVNDRIAREAERRKIWCSVVDDPDASTLHGAAMVQRGAICIGVTTGGGSPALARHLKEKIENCIGDEYAQLLNLMSARRGHLKNEIETQHERADLWRRILESEILDLLREGKLKQAEILMNDLTRRATDH